VGLLDVAIAHSDQADLVILNHVETLRDQIQPATPSAVASLIGGAPPVEIARRLDRLSYYGALELNADRSYQLTHLGCELLMQELVGWSPSQREQRRRDHELFLASLGKRQD
jgi:hypothetical protein